MTKLFCLTLLMAGLILTAVLVLGENREAIHAMLGFPYDLAYDLGTNRGIPGKIALCVLSAALAGGVIVAAACYVLPASLFKEGGVPR